MADILVPVLGESVTEATVAKWTKTNGDAVKKDEVLVELETDKVSLEVASPADGTLQILVTALIVSTASGASGMGTPGFFLARTSPRATQRRLIVVWMRPQASAASRSVNSRGAWVSKSNRISLPRPPTLRSCSRSWST